MSVATPPKPSSLRDESAPPALKQQQKRRRSPRLHPQVRLPTLVLVVSMAMLSLQRLAVWAFNPERFADVGAADVVRAMLVGLRFDLVIGATAAAIVLAILAPTPQRLLQRRWFKRSAAALAAVALTLIALAAVADFYFFREFDARLNHLVLDYIRYESTLALIWRDWPVIPALAGVGVIFAGCYLLCSRVGAAGDPAAYPPVRTILLTLALIPLLGVSIRGTVTGKAINTSPAYFTGSMTLSQLALNGVFTLREAVYAELVRRRDLDSMYDLPPRDEALALVREAIASPGDRFADDPRYPLLRVTDTGKPQRDYNVALVMLESLSWHFLESMGGMEGLTPNLDRIAREGVLFDRCFAVGERTARGFAGIVGAFPDLPGRSITTRPEAEGSFFTIAKPFKQRGYDTAFIHGGQSLYDHRRAFLRSNGFDELINREDFTSRTFRTDLGWSDEDLYNETIARLERAGDTPTFLLLLTLSYHRPYLVPEGRVEPVAEGAPEMKVRAEALTSIRYTDWAIGRFLEQAKELESFDRTIFVFVADHNGAAKSRRLDATSYRVPFVIYAPGLVERGELEAPRRISTVASQTDIIPTIFSLLGGRYAHSSFGASALNRSASRGMAMMQRGEILGLFDSQQRLALVPPYDAEPTHWRFEAPETLARIEPASQTEATELQRLSRLALAFLRVASDLATNGGHDAPAEVARALLDAADDRAASTPLRR